MSQDITQETAAVLQHHVQALGADTLEPVLSDYAEDATIFTPNGPVKARQAIAEYFTAVHAAMPDFSQTFAVLRQDVEGEIAYYCWKATQYNIPFGTDTFVIRGGKIVTQTMAWYTPA
jgi:ketosteroid isomerase-like protein